MVAGVASEDENITMEQAQAILRKSRLGRLAWFVRRLLARR